MSTVRRKKPAAVRSSMAIAMFEMTVNGEAGEVVNYSRVEREDGSIEEQGRPEGMAAGLPLGEAMQQAFAAALPKVKRRKRC